MPFEYQNSEPPFRDGKTQLTEIFTLLFLLEMLIEFRANGTTLAPQQI
jgi:hypothetical protein